MVSNRVVGLYMKISALKKSGSFLSALRDSIMVVEKIQERTETRVRTTMFGIAPGASVSPSGQFQNMGRIPETLLPKLS